MGDLKSRRYGANVRDRMRGLKKKDQGPALISVFNKILKAPPQTVKHKVKSVRMKNVINQMHKKEGVNENGGNNCSASKNSKQD